MHGSLAHLVHSGFGDPQALADLLSLLTFLITYRGNLGRRESPDDRVGYLSESRWQLGQERMSSVPKP